MKAIEPAWAQLDVRAAKLDCDSDAPRIERALETAPDCAPLPVAVIGHEVSEFVVIASGLRMLGG